MKTAQIWTESHQRELVGFQTFRDHVFVRRDLNNPPTAVGGISRFHTVSVAGGSRSSVTHAAVMRTGAPDAQGAENEA